MGGHSPAARRERLALAVRASATGAAGPWLVRRGAVTAWLAGIRPIASLSRGARPEGALFAATARLAATRTTAITRFAAAAFPVVAVRRIAHAIAFAAADPGLGNPSDRIICAFVRHAEPAGKTGPRRGEGRDELQVDPRTDRGSL